MITLTVDGTEYNYPEQGDKGNWGSSMSGWAQAITLKSENNDSDTASLVTRTVELDDKVESYSTRVESNASNSATNRTRINLINARITEINSRIASISADITNLEKRTEIAGPNKPGLVPNYASYEGSATARTGITNIGSAQLRIVMVGNTVTLTVLFNIGDVPTDAESLELTGLTPAFPSWATNSQIGSISVAVLAAGTEAVNLNLEPSNGTISATGAIFLLADVLASLNYVV